MLGLKSFCRVCFRTERSTLARRKLKHQLGKVSVAHLDTDIFLFSELVMIHSSGAKNGTNGALVRQNKNWRKLQELWISSWTTLQYCWGKAATVREHFANGVSEVAQFSMVFPQLLCRSDLFSISNILSIRTQNPTIQLQFNIKGSWLLLYCIIIAT